MLEAKGRWWSVGVLGQVESNGYDVPGGHRLGKDRAFGAASACIYWRSLSACGLAGGGRETVASIGPEDANPAGSANFFIGGGSAQVDVDIASWLALRVWVEVLGQTDARQAFTGTEVLDNPSLLTGALGTAVVSRF